MSSVLPKLPVKIAKEFEKMGPCCQLHNVSIKDLADYFGVLSSYLTADNPSWFRGHNSLRYHLTPSALRYKHEDERNKALKLLSEFRRLAEIKLDKPPNPDDGLKWLQLAQHHGLPTRLLDWTENAVVALYFACQPSDTHGLVAVLNPITLNAELDHASPRLFDAHEDANIINSYLKLPGRIAKRGKKTIAILPIMNSQRIVLQKGVFTLHGTRPFAKDRKKPAASLFCLPIMAKSKPRLLEELDRVGINEMSLFPELEHMCIHLKRRAKLN